MSDMVERVAKAIEGAAVSMPRGNRSLGYYAGVGIDHYNHEYETIYPELLKIAARAAIEAMRYPTDAMKRSGWEKLKEKNDLQTRLGNSLVGVETPVYEAMIDAALGK